MLLKALSTLIFLAVSLIWSSYAQAQQRRVVTYQTVVSDNRVIDIDAYIFDSVDEEPHFPGGDGAMMKFINRERRYPAQAYNSGIEGRVLCGFVVTPDGTITGPEVIRGVEESLNKEAIRIISRMPRWVAGKIGDSKVPVYCILAIPFRR
ncbi:MAG: energy transducer TonB [Barnesiella sp.]|nr:energy transducer TonB [Barnesiella sp.]MBD5374978.1 energy transducer TonB [Bacteroides sp.]